MKKIIPMFTLACLPYAVYATDLEIKNPTEWTVTIEQSSGENMNIPYTTIDPRTEKTITMFPTGSSKVGNATIKMKEHRQIEQYEEKEGSFSVEVKHQSGTSSYLYVEDLPGIKGTPTYTGVKKITMNLDWNGNWSHS